jgi:hypothetical protein
LQDWAEFLAYYLLPSALLLQVAGFFSNLLGPLAGPSEHAASGGNGALLSSCHIAGRSSVNAMKERDEVV